MVMLVHFLTLECLGCWEIEVCFSLTEYFYL